MKIPVIYQDNRSDCVPGALLDDLISASRIKTFFRQSEGWVDISSGKVRVRASSDYSGPDRRTMASSDIAQREEIWDSWDLLRKVYSESPVGIALFDSQGRLIDANSACLDIFGITDVRDFRGISPFEDPRIPSAAWESLRKGETAKYESVFDFEKEKTERLPSASRSGTIYLDYLITPLMLKEQQFLTGYLVQVVDITSRKFAEEELSTYRQYLEELVNERTSELLKEVADRKKAEQALRESEGRFRSLVETTDDLIWELDERFVFTYVGPQAEKILGYDTGEILGRTIFDLMPANEAKINREVFQNIIQRQTPFRSLEHTVRHKDGRLLTLECSGVPVKDWNGNFRGYRGIDRDITERKHVEEERLKMNKMDSIGVLAGGLAHDFNNLLTSILGNISLAKLLITPEDKIFHLLDNTEKVAMRMSYLTNQLITFSMGGTPATKTENIIGIIKDSCSFVLSGSNVRCDFNIANETCLVDTDKSQISQAIQNIIMNARDAMPDGGIIKISTENITLPEGNSLPLKTGNYVKISVKDYGVGIPKGNLPKIFDPYFTTKAIGPQKGMGLGLSVCYSVIRNHGGTITVESEPGEGTVFSIYLPLSESKYEETEEKIVRGSGRVLIMDDEESVRVISGTILGRAGYKIEYARDGVEATLIYRKAFEAGQPFDAVLLDLTIPGSIGGIETIRKLLNIDPGVKAAVLSGYSNDPIMTEYEKYGFKTALAKPFTITRLTETVSTIIATN